MKKYILLIVLLSFCFFSCSNGDESSTSSIDVVNEGDSNDSNNDNNKWLIPISEVRDGGPGRDGIPSIDNPKFLNVENVSNLLTDTELVVGVKVGNEVRAYPHYILNWHEIINDEIEKSSYLAITYCPLTGTAIGWNRELDGEITSFGVSGLLYNNNVIPYDRLTNSNWSQIGMQCVNGELIGRKPETISLIETTWVELRSMYPNVKVLSTDTGFSRNYDIYPYGGYRTDNDYLIFPLSVDDNRLPRKERVHALIENGNSRVYRFETFGEGKAIKGTFNNKEILIVGGEESIVSFELNGDKSSLEFSYVFNNSESYFKDNEGTNWNIFGEAISGPRTGQKLKPTNSFMAYWFSIGAFFPNTIIFE